MSNYKPSTYEEIVEELDKNIPRDVVSSRDAGQGRKLSYLEGHYVIDRLNQVLGQGNWNKEVRELRNVYSGEITNKYGDTVFYSSYVATVVLYGKIGDRAFHIVDVGYGDGSDKTNPGKPHELATKEAVTDALKRCAKDLGQSMGLALYNKLQENVGEEVLAPPSPKPTPIVKAEPKAKAAPKKQESIKDPKEQIRQAAGTLDSSKKLSIAEFKNKYKIEKLDDMPNEAVLSVLVSLKKDFPELNLN